MKLIKGKKYQILNPFGESYPRSVEMEFVSFCNPVKNNYTEHITYPIFKDGQYYYIATVNASFNLNYEEYFFVFITFVRNQELSLLFYDKNHNILYVGRESK